MFFHGCSYKNSCFNVLVYESSVLVLMVYSHKDVLKDPALDLVGTFSFEGLLYFVYNFGQPYITILKIFLRHYQKIFKSYAETASHHTRHLTCYHWKLCKFLSHYHFV